MSGDAGDWVHLSTPEFVAWCRLVEVRMPFPLNTASQPYIAAPARDEIEQVLGERQLDGSAALEAARAAFADPRLSVYAVRVTSDGTEAKYCSVAARDDSAVLVTLDPTSVALRRIADTELAASVVGALPLPEPAHVPSVELPVAGLLEIDAAMASAASPRAVRAQMSALGFPPELIALREQTGAEAVTTGVLGALGYPEHGEGRHSTRSATWREFEQGGLLQIERGARRGEAVVLVTPLGAEALFRAAVDAVSSVYEPQPT
jgi:hypothetical protein